MEYGGEESFRSLNSFSKRKRYNLVKPIGT